MTSNDLKQMKKKTASDEEHKIEKWLSLHKLTLDHSKTNYRIYSSISRIFLYQNIAQKVRCDLHRNTGWGRKDERFKNGYNSAKVVVTYIRPVPCNPLQLSIFLLVTHPSICCALPIVFSF